MLSSLSSINRIASRPAISKSYLPTSRALTKRCISIRANLTGPAVTNNQQLRTAATKSASTSAIQSSIFAPLDTFPSRHVGPRDEDIKYMLKTLGFESLDDFVNEVVPDSIRTNELTNEELPVLSESQLSKRAEELSSKNILARNYIGMGYWNAVMPPAIARNVLENPAWYTSYTPYQPEISQGRLESLINYQTMISSLTGLPISNASLLDEATAAAEAMTLSYNQLKGKKKTYLVDRSVYPQTMAVLRNRSGPTGINLVVGNIKKILEGSTEQDRQLKADCFGALLQYPERRGDITDWASVTEQIHELGGLVTCATDLLSLTKIKPPGEWGADIAVGNSARFGVPLGYGGPHAAFFAVKESLTRKIPGRLIGVSKDANGKPAYRLTLQTREQHIRRDKALSNVCTAQALLANLAAFYAVYHGPHGLSKVADKVHAFTQVLEAGLKKLSYEIVNESYFDRLTVNTSRIAMKVVMSEAEKRLINLRSPDDFHVGITMDESHSIDDLVKLLNLFVDLNDMTFNNRRSAADHHFTVQSVLDLAKSLKLDAILELPTSNSINASSSKPTQSPVRSVVPSPMQRQSKFLEHKVFNSYHSETALMRYIYSLQAKDLSLVDSMIPLGSCTMKLNSASSMMPLSMKKFSELHPFAPVHQAKGYLEMIRELEEDLSRITGFPAISLQPNSGAQGEYAGLSVIRAYHHARGDKKREVCLVPVSAHGTNPASAVMAGMRVISIKTTNTGELDLVDLEAKASKHAHELAAIMITYPSTFGVFEPNVAKACEIIHRYGGQVYLDGANMNAQIGLTNPVKCGADVCHLNLHKTFGIPHGGGGPGVGPIGVASHLAKYLPGHPLIKTGGSEGIEPVTSAPWGSASILTISWAYIKMLGGSGLTLSSKIALLSANYMAKRLEDRFEVKYTNALGRCAHEFILDFAEFDKKAGIKVMDVAKRLIDYGFHPPTCSWPISTAMLIEPTESEDLAELDRFCDAMISIRQELDDIMAEGSKLKETNVIKNAPHTIEDLTMSEEEWASKRSYNKVQAVYPVNSLRKRKFWPSVARIDDAYGDMNIFCTCPSTEEVAEN